MEQLEVQRERWKPLLTVRLTPKMKDYICDLQHDPESTYQELKTALLAHAGLTRAQAGNKWHSLTKEFMRGKSPGEYYQALE